jgi:tetratricopeptide (TPR) repeat protein
MVLAIAGASCAQRPCACPALAAVPPAPAARPIVADVPETGVPADWRPYVIEPGDTPAMIAACRDVPLDTLARANAIVRPDWILAGATLQVPADDLCAAQRRIAARRRSDLREAAVAREPTAPQVASRTSAEFQRGQRLLDAARARYDAADFDGALLDAEAAADAFARAANHPGSHAKRAQAHVVAGISAVGLEERERALAEFQRAFALDPASDLDPDDRSPRLVELFRLARDAPESAARP